MTKQLLKSGIIVSSMTFLSRILGLVRDIVMANLLGATWVTDVFLVAQKIPNFLRRLFAEGAFSQAFVPVLSEYQTNRELQEVKKLIAETAGTLGLVLSAVAFIGVIGSPLLVSLFGPGFVGKPDEFALASLLLKITFPYILFISLTAFCGSILNSVGRFAIPAFTPVLLNISMISAAIIVSPALPDATAMALAWGIFAAGVAQLLFQLPFLWREGLLVKPKWGWRSDGVQKILTLMGPALFGVSVAQINLLLDTVIASFLEKEGSITWLYYSDRMLEFPLGIFAIAISTVILPSLSRQHVSNNAEDFNQTMNWGLRLVFLIGIPATIGLFMMSEPIILSVFQHGEFSLQSAHSTSLSLKAYIIGLLGFMLVKVLATGFFSRQDTKTPVKTGIIAMVTNMVFNLILFYPLEHVGLALATAISGLVNSSLLFINLRRAGVFKSDGRWKVWFIKLACANLVLIGFITAFMGDIELWQGWTMFERGWHMAVLVIGAVGVYALSLIIFGVRMKDLRHA
ncbi:murein biosynthesis integral membrane protein MurJ [Aliikangiella coralliicola]|uniref:Probable lipid II flippase MurJ n=1 Tax=Aliikangiella coralliicola TaxID=2592383 RepID=A0A545UAA6_9GAMM|nr:murein biosynthesis integral membrane protein MurJ [Aliikangiella coralliicola]TQV86405.1 murein biosynthesis integral membrane protein MurJ [Aliikangiella coralliicola]